MTRNNSADLFLEIHLLGNFRAKAGEFIVQDYDWGRRSAHLLVKFLALQPQHQARREQIIEQFWAEQDAETAVNNLNKAIYSARRALEPTLAKAAESRFIKTQKHQITLTSPGELSIDAEEFERLANDGIKRSDVVACERALELYAGDLLGEDVYEDWTTLKRESLRLLYRKLVTKFSELYILRGDYARSVELLNKLALEDPTDERAHQQLMRLYALTGSKFQALKQFEACRNALRALGVEPEPETFELRKQILDGNIRPTIPKDPAFVPPSLAQPPAAEPQSASQAKVRQLTFQQGIVQSAKFSPGGETIYYSAAWEGGDSELYRIHDSETNSLATINAGIYAVSPAGELAVSLDRRLLRGYVGVGTLASLNLKGGEARRICNAVQFADWHPAQSSEQNQDGKRFVITRDVTGRNRLEYPIGNRLCETGGWFSHPRFSPGGDLVAFVNHPTLADDSGSICIVNLAGEKTTLSGDWISVQGLAWHSSGKEIWFTAAREGNARSIYAVNLDGAERLIYQGIGSLTLHDLSKQSCALVSTDKTRIRIAAGRAGETDERDLSWHDWSLVRDMAGDGKTILLTEAGESGGALYATYIRGADGTAARRLGNGSALALSPDGNFALVRLLTQPQQLALLPTTAGAPRLLATNRAASLNYQPWACFFPDGERILFAANEEKTGTRLYIQDLAGIPRCLTPDVEGVEISSPHSLSPDGAQLAMVTPDKRICLLSTETGDFTPLADLDGDLLPVRWSGDGKYLFVRQRGQIPAEVWRYEFATGKREKWLKLMPREKTGVHEILRILLTPDGSDYAYSYTRDLSDLYVIEGLR